MKTANDYYDKCLFFLEEGNLDGLLQLDKDHLYQLATELSISKPSPHAHYLLALYYGVFEESIEKSMEQRLKAARLGHGASVVDYLEYDQFSSSEILGIAKAMIDSGLDLASSQEDFDDELTIFDGDKLSEIDNISIKVKQDLKEKGLSFFWS